MIVLEVSVPNDPSVLLDRGPMKMAFRAAGQEVAAATRRLLRRTSGGGRLYSLGNGQTYRASAPGEAPVIYPGHRRSGNGYEPLNTAVSYKVWKSGEGVAIREKTFYAVMLAKGAAGGKSPGRGGGRGARNPTSRRGGKSFRVGVSSGRVLDARPSSDTVLADRGASITKRVIDAVLNGIRFVKMR